MMRYFNKYDQGIIMTGDGDYYWVLEYLLEQKKKVKLFSFRRRTARELKRLAGSGFTDLSRLKEMFKFRARNKKATDAFKGSAAGIMSKRYHKNKSLSRRQAR